MERKRKNPKIASATVQEIESNDLRRKQQKGSNLALADTPLCDTITSLNWQYHSFPQNVVEKPSSSSKPHGPTQSPLPVDINQWQRKLNLQLLQNHAQHGHFPGYQLPGPGVNAPGVPQPFTPVGTIDGTSLNNHPQFYNLGYQFVYPNPGFPGYWDPSSWWQLCPPFTYTAPGAYGYVSSQHPNVADSATSLLQSFERGTPEKLSQKHQQLWDAQSAENVQLRSIICRLQSQITDYNSRILKLEAEIPLAKQVIEDPTAHDPGTAISRKTSKRGRPKKSTTSVDALPSLDKSQVQAQARKLERCKFQPEAKAHLFEKVILHKVEYKEEPSNPMVNAEQENKISKMLPISNVNMGVNEEKLIMSPLHSQLRPGMLGIQMCEAALDSSLDTKSDDCSAEDPNFALKVLSQEAEEIDNKGSLATCVGEINNRNLAWPYTISNDSGKNVLNMSSRNFYNKGNVIQGGGKFIPGWSCMDEEDASKKLVEGLVALSKDKIEEETRDAPYERR